MVLPVGVGCIRLSEAPQLPEKQCVVSVLTLHVYYQFMCIKQGQVSTAVVSFA